LSSFLIEKLEKVNIRKMTKIQQEALPIALSGKNLIANAMTG